MAFSVFLGQLVIHADDLGSSVLGSIHPGEMLLSKASNHSRCRAAVLYLALTSDQLLE